MTNPIEIVLVNLGVFQPYILDAIKNLQLFGNTNITVITDAHLKKNFSNVHNIQFIDSHSIDLEYFDELNELDASFRGGFWKNSSKRLFYVFHYMKEYNRKNCIHIENDVMVYRNLQKLIPKTEKVWMVMDQENRSIPSILFVPDYRLLESLVENYRHHLNDMDNMAYYFNENPELCNTLPIIAKNTDYNYQNIFSHHFETFHSVFDGAAIGQYLGGIDPRNNLSKKRKILIWFMKLFGKENLPILHPDTRGFINETCVVDYSKYRFGWIKESGNFVPHIKIKDEWIPIVNLHIHSKRLKKFNGKNPQKTKLIPLID